MAGSLETKTRHLFSRLPYLPVAVLKSRRNDGLVYSKSLREFIFLIDADELIEL